MNKWDRKTRRLYIVLVISTIAVVPMAVNCLFKTTAPCDFFAVNWSAGDVLSYLGAVFASLASLYLGLDAKMQETARERNVRANSARPFLIIESITSRDAEVHKSQTGSYEFAITKRTLLSITLKNIGEGPACSFIYPTQIGFGKSIDVVDDSDVVAVNDVITVSIWLELEYQEPETVIDLCRLEYQNIRGAKYLQVISAHVQAFIGDQNPDSEEPDLYNYITILSNQPQQVS